MVAMGIVVGGHLKFIFIEGAEGEVMVLDVKMPVGTSFAETESNMRILYDAIESVGQELDAEMSYSDGGRAIEHVAVFIGTSPFSAAIAANSDGNVQSHIGQNQYAIEAIRNPQCPAGRDRAENHGGGR